MPFPWILFVLAFEICCNATVRLGRHATRSIIQPRTTVAEIVARFRQAIKHLVKNSLHPADREHFVSSSASSNTLALLGVKGYAASIQAWPCLSPEAWQCVARGMMMLRGDQKGDWWQALSEGTLVVAPIQLCFK
eukprot:7523885-Alexandrium_andersonii.AAC.1